MDQNDDFQLVAPSADDVSAGGRTPMMQQYMEAKRAEPEAILFFRMGDFYEMFYEDALTAAPILEIALTTRDKKSDNPVPMCGIPHHALENYIGKLIRAGHRIAICDQVEDPKLARGLVKREITRVVTPGTVLEDNLLEARENNYLCAIAEKSGAVAAAFVDISTGEFKVLSHAGADRWERLAEDLDLLRPREIVHPGELVLPESLTRALGSVLTHGQDDWWFGIDIATEALKRHFGVASLDAFGFEQMAMIAACGGALQYLRDVQRANLGHLQEIRIVRTAEFLQIDDVSRRNLELTESWMTGDKRDSLLGLLDKTTTSMGARLLRQWLLQPLMDLGAIAARHDAVGELQPDAIRQRELEQRLRPIADMERLLTRMTLKSANARDIVALRRSIEALPAILASLEGCQAEVLRDIAAQIDPLEDIGAQIAHTVVEEPPLSVRDGGIIAPGADSELDELRAIVKDNKSFIADIEHRERGRTGIPNLKVKYNKVFGYYIEVSRANLDLVPDDYFRKQTLVGAERFITPELKEFESKVLNAQDRIVVMEYEMFSALRDAIAAHGARIQRTARALARLDVLRCLAENAAVNGYTRPEMSAGEEIVITAGRHPVVERLRIEERFIPNDTLLDTSDNRLLIITGPNMGGKSTYLRQVALIVILAQVGSFVPARAARIGLVDRIFTRIGASDYLARGHSTFMVEMSETANILRNATRRSLIILDEVGRGTSTFDGLSIAWAVAEFIHDHPRLGAKTLFATHYHELTELAATLPGVRNYNVAAKEHKDDVIFLRTVVPGPSDQSYGIQVAKLAGMPREVVQRARQILKNLEAGEFDREGKPRLTAPEPPPAEHPIVARIRAIDTDRLTPIEALQLLNQLKKEQED